MHATATMTSGRGIAVLAAAALLTAGGITALTPAAPAQADGPTTFSNTAPIALPDPEGTNRAGAMSPYPSSIDVSGMSGPVQEVSVTLTGLDHSFVNDLDMLLVAPGGESLVVLSDVGGSILSAADADITLADNGAAFPEDITLPSGTYAPMNADTGTDDWPDPAPDPGAGTTFGEAFSGIDPNGVWDLYVVDDTTGDGGSITGGWSLTITTAETAAATTTTFSMDPNPAFRSETVTFTAQVTSGGEPVTEGTVTFAGPGASHPGIELDSDGSAVTTLPADADEDEVQQWTATYTGTPAFATSTGTAGLVINDRTVVSGNTYCNPGQTTVPDRGTARGYPLQVFVDDRSGATVTDARVHLRGLQHSSTRDLDLLLVSPDGDSLVLLSDVSGNLATATDLVVADDGDSPSRLEGPGAYQPTNLNDGSSDAFPDPAPAPSNATTFADSVVGGSANGTWSLYIVDDATSDSGVLADGWCLELTSEIPTETTLDAPASVTTGEDVEVTATVTGAGDPVEAGTVSYTLDGGTPVEAGTPNADGQVTFTIEGIERGAHTIAATYTGAVGYADSEAQAAQITAISPTTTSVTAEPGTPVVNEPVDISAAVSADGSPVTEGTVEITIGADVTTIDAADLATETVTFTPTSDEPIQVTAAYSGAETFATSEDQITLTPGLVDTTLSLDAPGAVVEGEAVQLQAEVGTVGGTPTGTVTFSDGADELGTAAVSDGVAELSTTLPAGVRTVTATFTSEDGYATSEDEAEIEVSPVVVAGGPYQVAEGGSLSLSAEGSSPAATIGWDVNGDGDFTDAAGADATLTWAELEDLGIDDGPANYEITAQAEADGLTSLATATLEVTNTGPDVIIDGPVTAVVGEPLTLKLSADDPSGADMAELFTYSVDWGDGSSPIEVVGPADPPVTHTYTETGEVQATFSVADRDGASGGEATLTITVEPSEEVPDETPTPDPTEPPTDTGDEPSDPGDDTDDGSTGGSTDTGGAETSALPGTGISGIGLGVAAAVLLLALGTLLTVVRRRLHS